MPLNSLLIPQIGKFGIIFDAIPREIDDLAVSSRQIDREGIEVKPVDCMDKLVSFPI